MTTPFLDATKSGATIILNMWWECFLTIRPLASFLRGDMCPWNRKANGRALSWLKIRPTIRSFRSRGVREDALSLSSLLRRGRKMLECDNNRREIYYYPLHGLLRWYGWTLDVLSRGRGEGLRPRQMSLITNRSSCTVMWSIHRFDLGDPCIVVESKSFFLKPTLFRVALFYSSWKFHNFRL